MNPLNLKAIKAIENLINDKFDSITLKLLGLIPKVNKEKKIIFSIVRNNLTSLFLQSLGTRDPNKSEENILKVMLRIASKYMDALKEKTKADIISKMAASFKTSSSLKGNKLQRIFKEEMGKAQKSIGVIAVTESNRVKNVGTALQITKVGKSQGIEDPTVFLMVVRDKATCKECLRLHLLPDKVTPRVWKLSELGSEQHKRGDKNSKIQGLHIQCRCTLTFLSPGWGFNDKGKISFKGKGWDELSHQRKKK